MTRLHKTLNSKVDRALYEYKMIQPNDRVLVAVSGGADSMALVDLLQQRLPNFVDGVGVFAVFVDLGFGNDSAGRCEQIRGYFRSTQICFRVIKTDIGTYSHSEENRENPCFLCSRLRRKKIFECAEEFDCNKIAFGHHKNDIVETLLINMLWGREISTMSPNLAVFSETYHIIRPLMYIDEDLLKKYCWERALPIIPNECPTAGNSKRQYIKNLLHNLEADHKGSTENIFQSMKRVKPEYLL